MAVPKRKVSKERKRKRRSHHALTTPNVVNCPECGEPRLSHRACPGCGFYNGRKVLASEE
ncbi:MAG: 50S ribosomal protein L32 [Deltaproteobacteria bacterium]|nr:50S ribosomal protein L32 [Deltaproteobacteria bacterium]